MDGSMFIGTVWSLLPPILAIVLALITKEVYSSLFLGVAVGALMYSGFHPWESFVTFFDVMKNSMNLNILIFDVLLGMIIVLMAKSGGSGAYGRWAGERIKSKKSASLATMGLGVLIFVDDYFNCLTVGSVMRPVTDRYKISRAKLAYIIDATAAPVCIIAPISSWAAAVNSYVPENAGITGFQLFLQTIPYNLYALLTLVMVFYICVSGWDFGLMKTHEKNAAKGDLFTSGKEEFEQLKEEEGHHKGKVIDLVLPVATLIISAVGAMIYTGYQDGAEDIITAFAGCDAETSLIFATTVTILFMLLLYLPRKVITFKGFMDSMAEGFKLMVPAVTILIFAWSLKGIGDLLGIASFVEGMVGNQVAANMLVPMIMFCVAIFLAFSTGTSWGTFAILVPIVVALFENGNLEMMIISVSAVLAGAVCGDHVSPISDTTVMSSAGAQSNHINHVSTQMQYAMVVGGVCIVGYLLAGLIQVWWIVLGISLALLLIVLSVMRYLTKEG
ncbi:MAG: Na+/H+ antiporter NhaC family protein [Lachnospiraceae bacterium]